MLAGDVLHELLARGGHPVLLARDGEAFALQILLQRRGAPALAEPQAQQRSPSSALSSFVAKATSPTGEPSSSTEAFIFSILLSLAPPSVRS